MPNSPISPFIAALGLGGALALLAGVAPRAPHPQVAPPGQPLVTVKDSKEHTLTIFLDLGRESESIVRAVGDLDDFDWLHGKLFPMLLALDSPLPEVWVPLAVSTPWTEHHRESPSLYIEPRRGNETFAPRPFPLHATPGEVEAARWFRGPDRIGPDGFSRWEHIVLGPAPDRCCAPTIGVDPEAREAISHGLAIDMRVRSHQPRVNERALAVRPWTEVPEYLKPFLVSQPYVETDDPAVLAFAAHWGGAPKSRSPWATARAIASGAAGRADLDRIARRESISMGRSRLNDFSMMMCATRGLRVKGAAAYAASGRGNSTDAHCLAVAAMRAVGIPARVILGWEVIDVPLSTFDPARLVTWGEFWMEGAGWIPFDCAEMRSSLQGNASPASPLDGFGSPEMQIQRVAWSSWFDPPFAGAVARERPAAYSVGPVVNSPSEVKERVERDVKLGLRRDEDVATYPTTVAGQLQIFQRSGMVAATRRASAAWPMALPDHSKNPESIRRQLQNPAPVKPDAAPPRRPAPRPVL